MGSAIARRWLHRWPSQAARLCVIRSRLHRPTCRRGPSLPRGGIPGPASEARADARIEAGQAVLSEDPDHPARYPADLFRCYAPDLPDAVFTDTESIGAYSLILKRLLRRQRSHSSLSFIFQPLQPWHLVRSDEQFESLSPHSRRLNAALRSLSAEQSKDTFFRSREPMAGLDATRAF